jgi:hypothetical protein
VSWEVPSDRAAQSVADGLLMTGATVAACPTAVKASSSVEDTGVCNASVARFAASELRRMPIPRTRRSRIAPPRTSRTARGVVFLMYIPAGVPICT